MIRPLFVAVLAAALLTTPAAAQDMSAFKTGPVFEDFGPHAPVEVDEPLLADQFLAHSYDVAEAAEDGKRNRGFESAARFINMHVANGMAEDRIAVAVVVHGKAVLDVITDDARESRDMAPNGSAAMVKAMIDYGVRYIVCGQSAAAQGITKADLIEGVEMELSAMTAHALLQRRGYTVNPF